jgi:spore maturation protein CgeB
MGNRIKIALISDNLTEIALKKIADIRIITPNNYKSILESKKWRADFLFVESAWRGYRNMWKYKIASFPFTPQKGILRKLYKKYYLSQGNKKLQEVVLSAKKSGIPTVFWNKEDGVHFNRFIESAKLFDHIFTVDENMIPKYKSMLPSTTTVNSLMFAVEPSLHNFTGFNFKYNMVNFVGSYSQHIHSRRREWQDMMFNAVTAVGLDLVIFDRNSDRKSEKYRFPRHSNRVVYPAVPYSKTAQIYNDYYISLNVNTIENSATMFSRRLVEIIACGGVAITNPSPAIEKYFADYCFVVNSIDETINILEYLKGGISNSDLKRVERGAKYILENHTWKNRLMEIVTILITK